MSTLLKTAKGYVVAYRLAEEQEALQDYILKTLEGKEIQIPGNIIFTIDKGTCYYLNFGFAAGQKRFDAYMRLVGETKKDAAERLSKGVIVINSGIIKKAVPINSIDQIFVQ